ncbi:MAG: hypothetical protein LBR19_04835 [Bifidobacteriaceae bacterium]|jgi:glycerophosphoryl diester phosphodiesterase|nr:hypothetical protein [Bifidobacteriaceae bacterium]
MIPINRLPKTRQLCQFTLVAALVAAGGLAAQPHPSTALAADPCDSSAWDQAAIGAVVLDETFDGTTLPNCWQVHSGTWTVANGRLVGTGGSYDAVRITFGQHLNDFKFEATYRFDKVNGSGRWAGLVVDIARTGGYPWSHAIVRSGSTASNGVELAQRTPKNDWWVHDEGAAPTAAGTGKDITVVVEVHGTQANYYYNGQEVLRTAAFARSAGGVLGLVVDGSTVGFDRVTVTKLGPATGGAGCLPGDPVQPNHTGLVVAHRGNSGSAPENTLVAIEQAVALGAHMFETDIDYTKDGVPVLLHDSTVNRTTDGSGSIRNLTLAQVKAMKVDHLHPEVYTDVRIPTLEEVLAYMAATPGAVMLLEFKEAWPDDKLILVRDLIEQYGVRDRIIAQSFEESVLTGLYRLYPELQTMLLVLGLPSDPVTKANSLHASGINPSGSVTQAKVNAMHAAGLKIFVWTLDSTSDWNSAATYGIDGVITNLPGKALLWQNSYNAARGQEGVQCVAPEPLSLGAPKLTGTAAVGQTLNLAAPYTPANATVTYLWFRGTSTIKGASGTSYQLTAADAGQDLVVKVTVTKGSETITKYSNHVQVLGIASLTVQGTPKVGQTLTAAVVYQPAGAAVAYHWFRGSALVGSGQTYVVKAADAGQDMVLKVTVSVAGVGSQAKYSAHFWPSA